MNTMLNLAIQFFYGFNKEILIFIYQIILKIKQTKHIKSHPNPNQQNSMKIQKITTTS